MATVRNLILVATTYIVYRGYNDLKTRDRGDDVIPLSMMENSAAYIYTQSDESDILAIEYLEKESKHKDSNVIDEAWKMALKLRQTDPQLKNVQRPDGLKEEHVVALIAYTLLGKDYTPSIRIYAPLYWQFNKAVRLYGANDSIYAEKFRFKSFQYLLSVAIDRLKPSLNEPPRPIYRRVNRTFTGKVGDRMKFGHFASCSLHTGNEQFSEKTIFKIYSQYGARIGKYSVNPDQEEVLIPPYEAFKITSYEQRPNGVDISLHTDGVAGIRVRVERGRDGEMRVLRYEGISMSPLAWIFILTLLALFLLRYRERMGEEVW